MIPKCLAALLALLCSVAPALAARTDLTVVTPVSINGSIAANGADVAEAAGDASNGNQFTMTGGEIIWFRNSGGSPYTVTLTSVADSLGRTGHITAYSIGAGEVAVFGPFPTYGWRQSNGKFYIDVENTAVKIQVVRPR